ncbi:MAG: hypothetical protein Phog2KO_09750 [Phototrophicaceae bacterium]
MVIYYFGYGSNLSSAMMRDWCPDYQLIGAGQLIGWELVFTRFSERWGAGVADIIQRKDSIVWGGLYQISEADLVSLDIKESNGQHYQRISCEVIVNDLSYKAFTYVVIDKSSKPIASSNAYRDTMLTGAQELNLPEAYIAKIANLPISG